MQRSLFALVCSAFSAAAFAAPAAYTLDPGHTIPRFEIKHNGLSFHIGSFLKSEGRATLDLEGKSGSVEVTIQTASVLTGHAVMEAALKDKDFFNIAQFPTMTFRSTRMRFDGDKPAAVEGEFTLLGVTRPLTLTFVNFTCAQHPRSKKDQCGGNLEGHIKRSDYGMKAYVPVIADEVRLLIQVEAFKD